MKRRNFLIAAICGIPVLGMFSQLPITVSQPIDPESGVWFGNPEASLSGRPSDLAELRRQVQTGYVHHWHLDGSEENVIHVRRLITGMER